MRGENARGAVGALEEGADAGEVKGFVAQHGADGDAASEVRAFLDPFDEMRRCRCAASCAATMERASSQVEFRVSQSSEVERAAHGAGVLARGAQAAEDAAGVVAVEAHELEHGAAARWSSWRSW